MKKILEKLLTRQAIAFNIMRFRNTKAIVNLSIRPEAQRAFALLEDEIKQLCDEMFADVPADGFGTDLLQVKVMYGLGKSQIVIKLPPTK